MTIFSHCCDIIYSVSALITSVAALLSSLSSLIWCWYQHRRVSRINGEILKRGRDVSNSY